MTAAETKPRADQTPANDTQAGVARLAEAAVSAARRGAAPGADGSGLPGGGPAQPPAKPPAKAKPRADLDFAPVRTGWLHQRPPLPVYILTLGVVVFFVVALIWANWAILDEVTTGEGRVIPSSQVQVVQNLEGGIVRDILAREGDIVEVDQSLMNIDNSAFVASYGELQTKYHGLLGAVARLSAEAEQTPLSFPPVLLAEQPAVAQSERSLYQARQSELQGQLGVFEQQVQQRSQELAEMKSRLDHLERSIALLRQELAISAPLVEQGVVPRIEFLRLQRQLNDMTGESNSVRINIPRAEAALREANRRIEQQFLAFRSEAQKELTGRRTELATITESITAARDRVQRTDVRSPVRGIVKQVKVSTVGGVVRPGMDLIEIVPLDDTLLVEARVRPKDIAFIRPDQEAIVKISAYDYAIYGGLKAKVERISADAIEEEATNQQKESYYKIVVRTEKNHLGTPEHPLPIIPGMVATADILTGKKSVLDYILKPVLRARQQALRER